MNPNIDELVLSDFWVKNQVEYNTNEKETKFINAKKWVMFTTNQVNKKTLETWETQTFATSGTMHPELYGNLRTNALPVHWQTEIIQQWLEVNNLVQLLEERPIMSFMIICSPGSVILPHKHNPKIKQTLTFGFNFPQYSLTHEKEGQFILYNNKVNIKNIMINQSKKVSFTWKNNLEHSANTNTLTFFWIYDFINYIELKNKSFAEFDFYDLDQYENKQTVS